MRMILKDSNTPILVFLFEEKRSSHVVVTRQDNTGQYNTIQDRTGQDRTQNGNDDDDDDDDDNDNDNDPV
jgi:hypothetical protein